MSESASDPVVKLIYMANQIAKAFELEPHDNAVAAIAEHIRLNWTPKMRREIIAQLSDGGSKLQPLAKLAVEKLGAKPPL